MEFVYKESYWLVRENGVYVKNVNGVCRGVEFTINGMDVRFITVRQEFNYGARTGTTYVIKETLNELGVWVKNGNDIVLTVNDKNFVDGNGDTFTYAEAIESVDDLEKEMLDYSNEGGAVSYDPKRYFQKTQIKDGLISEVELMKQLNPDLFSITEQRLVEKITNLYQY
jgi:hypothetical protein